MTFLLTESLSVTDVSSPEEQNTMEFPDVLLFVLVLLVLLVLLPYHYRPQLKMDEVVAHHHYHEQCDWDGRDLLEHHHPHHPNEMNVNFVRMQQ